MTDAGWAERAVAKVKQNYGLHRDWFGVPLGNAVVLVEAEHARAVRIVKATRKGVPSEPCEAWKDGYMTACDDILAALTKGRGKGK